MWDKNKNNGKKDESLKYNNITSLSLTSFICSHMVSSSWSLFVLILILMLLYNTDIKRHMLLCRFFFFFLKSYWNNNILDYLYIWTTWSHKIWIKSRKYNVTYIFHSNGWNCIIYLTHDKCHEWRSPAVVGRKTICCCPNV